MDWTPAIEEEVAMLKRIVALLLSLAGLAELAADRSPVVRALMLWLLRHAERAARSLVAFEPDASSASLPIVPTGGSPADALHLAAALRALATQLDLLARMASAARSADRVGPACPHRVPAKRDALDDLSTLAAFALPLLHPPQAPDTS